MLGLTILFSITCLTKVFSNKHILIANGTCSIAIHLGPCNKEVHPEFMSFPVFCSIICDTRSQSSKPQATNGE